MARKEKISKRIIIHTILIISCILALYPILRVVTISLRPGDRAFSDSLSVIPDEPTLEAYNTILFEKGYSGGKAAKRYSMLRQIKIKKLYEKTLGNEELEKILANDLEKHSIKKDIEKSNLEKIENKKRMLTNENSENREKIIKNNLEIENYKLSKKSTEDLKQKYDKLDSDIKKDEEMQIKLTNERLEIQQRLDSIANKITNQHELKIREKEISGLRKKISATGKKIKKLNDKITYYKRQRENLEKVINIKNTLTSEKVKEKIEQLKNMNLESNDIMVSNSREIKKIDREFVDAKYLYEYYEYEHIITNYVKNAIERYYSVNKKIDKMKNVKELIETENILKTNDEELKSIYEDYKTKGLDIIKADIIKLEEEQNKDVIDMKANAELEKLYGSYKNKTLDELKMDMQKLIDKQKSKGYRLFNSSFWLWFVNSMIVSFFTVFFGVLFALTAGYSFSRYDFWGKKFGLTFFLITQMFPPVMLLLPMYLVMSRISISNLPWLVSLLRKIWVDPDAFEVYSKLITIYVTTALPVCVWQMKGYYDTIPYSLEEAALIDGCNPFQAFYKIILPLVKPGIVVTALFSFMAAWTDFVVANVMVQAEKYKTLPLGLQSMNDRFKVEWANFSASSILVMIPAVLLFMYLSKFLVSGLTLGGVKE